MERLEDPDRNDDAAAATASTELLLASGARRLERSRELLAELDAAINRSSADTDSGDTTT